MTWTASVLPITTGAAPQTITLDHNVLALVVRVTSGGTGGVEILNLPDFVFTSTNSAAEFYGYRTTIVIDSQTSSSDVVVVTLGNNGYQIRINNSGGFNLQGNAQNLVAGPTDGVPLTYEGTATSLIWVGNRWVYDDPGIASLAIPSVPDQYSAITMTANRQTMPVLYTVATALRPAEPFSRTQVSDLLNPVWGQPATGGGNVVGPIYWDGSIWRVG